MFETFWREIPWSETKDSIWLSWIKFSLLECSGLTTEIFAVFWMAKNEIYRKLLVTITIIGKISFRDFRLHFLSRFRMMRFIIQFRKSLKHNDIISIIKNRNHGLTAELNHIQTTAQNWIIFCWVHYCLDKISTKKNWNVI